MEIGFEVTAARPKGLRADDPAPTASMRGDRKITKNPTTDQKKVRRAQQRKTASMDFTAAMNDVGDCRLCGGRLIASPGKQDDTTHKAVCEDCNTTHMLQGNLAEKSASLLAEAAAFTDRQWMVLHRVAMFDIESETVCPHCDGKGWKTKQFRGWYHPPAIAKMHCHDCENHFFMNVDSGKTHPTHYGDLVEEHLKNKSASLLSKADQDRVLRYVGYRWVPQTDSSKYVTGGQPLSAIARRAREMSTTPEVSE